MEYQAVDDWDSFCLFFGLLAAWGVPSPVLVLERSVANPDRRQTGVLHEARDFVREWYVF